jgi:hypothetical protein
MKTNNPIQTKKTEEPKLDPRTSNVAFNYEPFGDYPDGDYNIGRVYYWYDPNGSLPAVYDDELRSAYPELSDREWQQLFYEAFDRAQTEFEAELAAKGMIDAVGRLFGPRPLAGDKSIDADSATTGQGDD